MTERAGRKIIFYFFSSKIRVESGRAATQDQPTPDKPRKTQIFEIHHYFFWLKMMKNKFDGKKRYRRRIEKLEIIGTSKIVATSKVIENEDIEKNGFNLLYEANIEL